MRQEKLRGKWIQAGVQKPSCRGDIDFPVVNSKMIAMYGERAMVRAANGKNGRRLD